MKRIWFAAGIMLLLLLPVMYAQTNTMDSASEKAVQITSGPTVDASGGSTATIHWTTNKAGANHVKYREVGTNNWQSAYHAGGGTDHTLQLTGLQQGKTYEYQILTRDGDVRTSGQFQAGSGATSASTNPATPAAPATPSTATGAKIPLYRFVAGNGEHAFNTSTSGPAGFRQEGIVGYILQSQTADTTPLYMLYTSSDAMLSPSAPPAGAEGNQVGFVAASQQAGTEPLYQMVDKQGHHFATANPQEHSKALSSGMKDEGVLGYVWQSPS